jgi:hypothetical protein
MASAGEGLHRAGMDASRDPAVDAYRALALAAVVLGHWLLTVTWWSGGSLEAHNLLDLAPWTQWATWLAQPVPLFFVVGGWASARSWRRARPHASRATWVAARADRLLVPVCTFTVAALIGGATLQVVRPHQVGLITRLLGMPLWFLAVYLPVTAAVPVLFDAVERWGWRIPRDLAIAAIAVDVCRIGGDVGGIGWLNFAFVWLCCASLGVAAEARPPRRGGLVAVGSVALTLLVAAVWRSWYPISMVGVGDRSNNTPPTAALLALGVVQACLAGLAAPAVRRVLARRARVRRSVGVVGAFGMHLYLWHLTATIALVAIQEHGFGNVSPLSAAWWWSRPLWLATLAMLASPVVVAAARVDLRRLQVSRGHSGSAARVDLRRLQVPYGHSGSVARVDERWLRVPHGHSGSVARVDERRLRVPHGQSGSAVRATLALVAATGGLTALALRGFGLGPVALGAVAAIQAASVLVVDRRPATPTPANGGNTPWPAVAVGPKVES